MRDEDRLMREVEEIAQQTRREAQTAIRERELGLVPLSGKPAIIEAVRDARYSMMQDLSRQWDYIYDHDRWGRWIALKPGLLGDIARQLKKLKKTKKAQFWFRYRNSEPDEVFLSELFKLKPIAGDSPLMAEARRARNRTLHGLLGLELITEDDVTLVFEWLDWLPLAFDWEWLETWCVAKERLKRRAENKNYKTIKKIAKTLSLQSPQFWYAHKDFELRELVERHFPDAQNRSKRGSALRRFAVYMGISAFFWYWGAVQYFLDWRWYHSKPDPDAWVEPEVTCGHIFFSLCGLIMLAPALKKLFSVRRNVGGRWLSGKSKKW